MNAAPAGKKPSQSRKNLIKKIGYAGGCLLFFYVMYLGFQPLRGSMNFGICKIFIEQNTTYPEEIRYTSLLEQPGQARIEYVILNEFGSYESKTITCRFRPDPVTGVAISDIVINRDAVPREKIELFNKGIPAILANPPDLVSPGTLGSDLTRLWRGYD